jgi:asparagine synthase (glutamine-hydrolysing)
MSGLAGVFHYSSSRPVSPWEEFRICGAPGESIEYSRAFHHASGLLMVHTTSRHDSSPTCGLSRSAAGNVCTWDGRLDNRGELRAKAKRCFARDCSDSEIALAIYETKGKAGLCDLIGDWSLVIWDAARGSLLLASDYAGVRPLYYCLDNGRVMWSSALQCLVDWTGAEPLDEEYAANFLTRGSAGGRTPYRNILPVPPGQVLEVSAGRQWTETFWSIPFSKTIDYPRESEYEEQLRTLFQEAVAVRLRTSTPVCAELSGGLDSSSIVCMAKELITGGRVDAPELITLSYRQHGSTDQKFYQAIERSCGLQGIHLETSEHPFLAPALAGRAQPVFWEPRFKEVSRRMAAAGANVLLTGQLGDLVMGNWMDDSEQVGDYLRERKIATALRETLAWSQALGTTIYPIFWRALRAAISPCVAPRSADLDLMVRPGGDSLTVKLRRRARALSGHRRREAWLNEERPARRKHLWALSQVLEARALQTPEPVGHIAYTHPFSHRPLVEFMMAIPPRIVCRPGSPRRLMRRAFAGLVPEPVLRRRSKAIYSGVFLESLRPIASGLCRNTRRMRLVELGYVDPDSAAVRLGRLAGGLECNEPQLRYLILLELWLRNRELQSEEP